MADESGDVMDIELLHDLLPVFLDRFYAQIQFGRDLFVRITLCDQLEHLRFALSKFDIHLLRSSGVGLSGLLTETFCDSWTEIRISFRDFPDGIHYIFGRGLFEQVSGSASGESLLDVLI